MGCPDICLNIISGCVWVYHEAGEVCWMQDGPEHEEIREKVLTIDGSAREMGFWPWKGYVWSLGFGHRSGSVLGGPSGGCTERMRAQAITSNTPVTQAWKDES